MPGVETGVVGVGDEVDELVVMGEELVELVELVEVVLDVVELYGVCMRVEGNLSHQGAQIEGEDDELEAIKLETWGEGVDEWEAWRRSGGSTPDRVVHSRVGSIAAEASSSLHAPQHGGGGLEQNNNMARPSHTFSFNVVEVEAYIEVKGSHIFDATQTCRSHSTLFAAVRKGLSVLWHQVNLFQPYCLAIMFEVTPYAKRQVDVSSEHVLACTLHCGLVANLSQQVRHRATILSVDSKTSLEYTTLQSSHPPCPEYTTSFITEDRISQLSAGAPAGKWCQLDKLAS
ncbi:hypothetical protein EDB83DRAFT_2311969 [Lactarius deliciosus]|nr:hypothetical protein EDB83DRAFT_2311969 [Lactarius deliciosus]